MILISMVLYEVELMRENWISLKGKVDEETYDLVLSKFNIQVEDAKEWRDVINTYFYRRTGINDIHNRRIYK